MCEKSESGTAEPTILCVDDEPYILMALERLLRRNGWRVLLAENGAQALETLAEHEIQVMLCDEVMPGMRGLDVLRKAGEVSPRTARILLTGHCCDPRIVMPAVNSCGIDRLLGKPWDDEDLTEAVASALGARPSEWRKQRDRLNSRLEELQQSPPKQV